MDTRFTITSLFFVANWLAMIQLSAQEVQEKGNRSAKRETVSLMTNWRFTPDPLSERPDPKRFFGFPFDIARQNAPGMCVDYSADGERLAIGTGWFNKGGELVVWDLEKNRKVFSVWMGLGTRDVKYSPDGKTIAIACFDRTAKLFDAETGERLAVFPLVNTNGTNSVSFSPDGSTIATGGLHQFVILWDTKTYRERMRLFDHAIRIYCAAYSPDGLMIASVDREGLGLVWDAKTGKSISALAGHEGGIETVDFTRDSLYVITGGWDGTVRFWDPKTGIEQEDLRRSDVHQGAYALATSHDGQFVASGGSGSAIEIFDYKKNQSVRFAHGQVPQIYGICFSPKGNELATASFGGSVKRWDATTHKLLQTIERKAADTDDPPSAIGATAWSPDGLTIVSGHKDGTIRIRDPMTSAVTDTIAAHSADVTYVSYRGDSKMLASCGTEKVVRLWNVSSGERIATLKGHSDSVLSCVFSPDGKLLATGSVDESIRIWDVKQGIEIQSLAGHESAVRSLDFSPDGAWLVSGETAGRLRRWNTQNWQGKPLAPRRPKLVRVAFSPSGERIAVGGESGGIAILDPMTWKEASRIKDTPGLTSFAWSPRGQFIATGNLKGKVALRDVETGEVFKTFGQRTGAVTSVAYAPSGTAYLAAGDDSRLTRRLAVPKKEKPNRDPAQ
jgi:WD40 repeat protein